MIDEAVVSTGPGETRIALFDTGQIVEFIVDRGAVGPGDIVEGRVVEVAAGLGAAFIDIGDPVTAFLPKPKDLGVGSKLLFAVTVGARAGKGAEVKRAPDGAKPTRRSALGRALNRYPTIKRVTVDQAAALGPARAVFRDATHRANGFEESGAADELEKALARRVELAGGAALIFAEAEAATVIDIDGGGLSAGAANEAALPEIARQLRLRAIGGHILVDAIPSRDRNAVSKLVAAMKAAVVDDPAPTQVAGRTPLGMIELTRRRHGPSLAETMLNPLTAEASAMTIGLQALRALLRETAARPGRRLALAVPPRVAQALASRPEVIAEAGKALGAPVALVERVGIEMHEIEEAR